MIQKFLKSFIVFEKPGICLKIWKNFDEFQLPYSSIFFAEPSHTFSAYQCLRKGVVDFILFCLDLELLMKV